MKKSIGMLCLLVLLGTPQQSWATDNCFQCLLGIWDDPQLTRNVGEIVVGQPKVVYVGIKLAEGFEGISGIALSIAGLSAFSIVLVEQIPPPGADTMERIEAPADTTLGSTQMGGATYAWSSCLIGDQPLLKLTLTTSVPITNGILKVKRRYPTLPVDARTPVITQCDNPDFTPTRVTGGHYILNWNGDPNVAVAGASWSLVKSLYR
jgi:hypothetical protein